MNSTSSEIIRIFKEYGHSEYGSEALSQAEHAFQCAALAAAENAAEPLILAALLHDIGHLLHQLPDDAPEHGLDDFHERLGADFLRKHFPPSVFEPVGLHVEAKRYLCAREAGYFDKLSDPSKLSLKLQGGIMSEVECAAFEQNPFYAEAIRLRKWDEEAKVPGWQVPQAQDYEQMLDRWAL
jgi:phosphonate degradation associated HDIG domain protein